MNNNRTYSNQKRSNSPRKNGSARENSSNKKYGNKKPYNKNGSKKRFDDNKTKKKFVKKPQNQQPKKKKKVKEVKPPLKTVSIFSSKIKSSNFKNLYFEIPLYDETNEYLISKEDFEDKYISKELTTEISNMCKQVYTYETIVQLFKENQWKIKKLNDFELFSVVHNDETYFFSYSKSTKTFVFYIPVFKLLLANIRKSMRKSLNEKTNKVYYKFSNNVLVKYFVDKNFNQYERLIVTVLIDPIKKKFSYEKTCDYIKVFQGNIRIFLHDKQACKNIHRTGLNGIGKLISNIDNTTFYIKEYPSN